MARKTAEELASMIRSIVGEDNNTDEVIELLEDVSDSVTAENDNSYTKEKFDELDRTWRERYTKRFMGEVSDDRIEKDVDEAEDEKEDITIEDLFDKKEEK